LEAAAAPPPDAQPGAALSYAAVMAAAQEAEAWWLGITSPAERSSVRAEFSSVTFSITDLPGSLLGYTYLATHSIAIDSDAAGWGWYTDASPESDLAFGKSGQAPLSSPAYGHMDLLSVVAHELGHFLGYVDSNNSLPVMRGILSPGERTVMLAPAPLNMSPSFDDVGNPSFDDLDALFSSDAWTPDEELSAFLIG
jgi:hypothetical protein